MQTDLVRQPSIVPMAAATGSPPPVIYGVLFDEKLMEWPGRNQLMRSLARHTTVILLQESVRGRTLRLPQQPRIEPLDDGLMVVRNAMDARASRLGRRIPRAAALADGRWLRTALQRCDLRDPLLWLTVPDPRLALGVSASRLLYDCMDPNFLPTGQSDHDRRELALARRAKVVFASADSLYRRMLSVNPNTHLLNNAAPVTPPAAGPRPVELHGRTGPVIGYLGTLDWRFDVEHVHSAALALPDFTFALVGRVNRDQEQRVAPLRGLPNVLLPGEVSLAEGDAWVNAFDVGLIPFVPGAMNDAINPVKMFMYLSVGLPVVSTNIAECRALSHVAAANSFETFAAAIARAVAEDNVVARDRRRKFAAENTWDTRAREAVDILRASNLWG